MRERDPMKYGPRHIAFLEDGGRAALSSRSETMRSRGEPRVWLPLYRRAIILGKAPHLMPIPQPTMLLPVSSEMSMRKAKCVLVFMDETTRPGPPKHITPSQARRSASATGAPPNKSISRSRVVDVAAAP